MDYYRNYGTLRSFTRRLIVRSQLKFDRLGDAVCKYAAEATANPGRAEFLLDAAANLQAERNQVFKRLQFQMMSDRLRMGRAAS